ncbi:MAG: flagellar assembly protein FliW [Deltaproteobacteria bacterium]|nr:flagellar assembly protein FliW [Deltaproteobacteria bacterium]
MKVETTRFGTVELPEEKLISMSHGMLGFADKKRFCLIQHKEESPFFWYQSLDDPALAFVITNRWLFKPDYEVDLDAAVQAMGWDQQGEKVALECYIIVTIPRGAPEKMTANLIGPMVLNPKTCEAVQIVLYNDSYSHKYPLVKKKAA